MSTAKGADLSVETVQKKKRGAMRAAALKISGAKVLADGANVPAAARISVVMQDGHKVTLLGALKEIELQCADGTKNNKVVLKIAPADGHIEMVAEKPE